MRIISLLVLLVLAVPARAGIEPADATEAIRARLRSEWQALVAARHFGPWKLTYRGVTYRGDRVVELAGWTYFLAGDERRCQIQSGEYLTCGRGDFEQVVGRKTPGWSAAPAPAPTVAVLRRVHRALFGATLAIEVDKQGVGHATIDAVVSTPDAPARTSRRYRATVTLTARDFQVGEPQLVEQYAETCYGINGCHATHWTCTRVP